MGSVAQVRWPWLFSILLHLLAAVALFGRVVDKPDSGPDEPEPFRLEMRLVAQTRPEPVASARSHVAPPPRSEPEASDGEETALSASSFHVGQAGLAMAPVGALAGARPSAAAGLSAEDGVARSVMPPRHGHADVQAAVPTLVAGPTGATAMPEVSAQASSGERAQAPSTAVARLVDGRVGPSGVTRAAASDGSGGSGSASAPRTTAAGATSQAPAREVASTTPIRGASSEATGSSRQGVARAKGALSETRRSVVATAASMVAPMVAASSAGEVATAVSRVPSRQWASLAGQAAGPASAGTVAGSAIATNMAGASVASRSIDTARLAAIQAGEAGRAAPMQASAMASGQAGSGRAQSMTAVGAISQATSHEAGSTLPARAASSGDGVAGRPELVKAGGQLADTRGAVAGGPAGNGAPSVANPAGSLAVDRGPDRVHLSASQASEAARAGAPETPAAGASGVAASARVEAAQASRNGLIAESGRAGLATISPRPVQAGSEALATSGTAWDRPAGRLQADGASGPVFRRQREEGPAGTASATVAARVDVDRRARVGRVAMEPASVMDPFTLAGMPSDTVFSAALAGDGNSCFHYPASARTAGLEGLVVLDVEVAMEGHAKRVAIGQGSGEPGLDALAMRQARECARFVVQNRRGQAVAARLRVPVRYRLERD